MITTIRQPESEFTSFCEAKTDFQAASIHSILIAWYFPLPIARVRHLRFARVQLALRPIKIQIKHSARACFNRREPKRQHVFAVLRRQLRPIVTAQQAKAQRVAAQRFHKLADLPCCAQVLLRGKQGGVAVAPFALIRNRLARAVFDEYDVVARFFVIDFFALGQAVVQVIQNIGVVFALVHKNSGAAVDKGIQRVVVGRGKEGVIGGEVGHFGFLVGIKWDWDGQPEKPVFAFSGCLMITIRQPESEFTSFCEAKTDFQAASTVFYNTFTIHSHR